MDFLLLELDEEGEAEDGEFEGRSFSVGSVFEVSALRETGSPSWVGFLAAVSLRVGIFGT